MSAARMITTSWMSAERRMAEDRAEYHTATSQQRETAQPDASQQSERWVKGSLPLPAWATEPEWVMRYGRALPLVIYLLKHADWTTGAVIGYSHTAAAEHYGCAKTTIAQQFRLLRECGKVAVTTQGQHVMDLVIARGPGILSAPSTRKPRKPRTPKADASGYQKIDNLNTAGYQESDTLDGSGYQKIVRRLSKNCYPLIDNRNITSFSLEQIDANASSAACADAVPPVPPTDPSEPASEHVPASVDVQHPPTPAHSPRKRAAKPRELSPKDQYRVDLLARVTDINSGVKPPNRDQEWAAAARFWTWKDGQPADIEQVAACYREEVRRPAWDSKYLSLQVVYANFGAYLRSPANYRKAIDRARAAADGTLVTAPPARAAPAAMPARTVRSASDVSPWK